ncbi:hypothetical protein H6F67_26420 [Microcoleus sp. FACHB-1515]|uniref:hypothetical protein n=1 Tax=Leptolyngbya sp. FACHB-1515 TaxID=2933931 RepID=UPI00168704D9|nr:hypothetical protein [Microcoleus sp. FACHB-1515]MBD2093385.1 hypothetical protein [Microcoleus sp. FACHB-1515]
MKPNRAIVPLEQQIDRRSKICQFALKIAAFSRLDEAVFHVVGHDQVSDFAE